MEAFISEDKLRSFRSSYLEIAQRLKEKQQKDGTHDDILFNMLSVVIKSLNENHNPEVAVY